MLLELLVSLSITSSTSPFSIDENSKAAQIAHAQFEKSITPPSHIHQVHTSSSLKGEYDTVQCFFLGDVKTALAHLKPGGRGILVTLVKDSPNRRLIEKSNLPTYREIRDELETLPVDIKTAELKPHFIKGDKAEDLELLLSLAFTDSDAKTEALNYYNSHALSEGSVMLFKTALITFEKQQPKGTL